ncbi:MAG: tRNA pseudouridine(38-40) synthase TruA [Actinobacteria bacterium]|nr:tRNA pseudouridine(38-40) synthase TruA [Actinomycetota bacterium]
MNTETEPVSNGGLIRVRLDLSYDGTNYFGWAKQPDGLRTIQGELESALAAITGLAEVKTIVGGRTDAGVHARGQVCHLDLPSDFVHDQLSRLARRLHVLLPVDIRINSVKVVPDIFDARFAALARRYSYRIADRQVDPLTRNWVLTHDFPLDIAAMNEASAQLIGLNDYAAFCKPKPGGSTIRNLLELSWQRIDDLVVGTFKADAFCHSMVRSLVGSLIPVGDGRKDIDWPGRSLRAAERVFDIPLAPAHGLVLEEIYYPDESEYAARIKKTQALRIADEVE